jgi:hypothetical protein
MFCRGLVRRVSTIAAEVDARLIVISDSRPQARCKRVSTNARIRVLTSRPISEDPDVANVLFAPERHDDPLARHGSTILKTYHLLFNGKIRGVAC